MASRQRNVDTPPNSANKETTTNGTPIREQKISRNSSANLDTSPLQRTINTSLYAFPKSNGGGIHHMFIYHNVYENDGFDFTCDELLFYIKCVLS